MGTQAEVESPRTRRVRPKVLAGAVAGAAVLFVGAVVVAAPLGAKESLPKHEGVGSDRAHQVITELKERGVITSSDEVISITEDAVALKGDPSEPWVTEAAGKANPGKGGGGGGGKGGGKGSTSTTTPSSPGGGLSSSYALQSGVGLLTSYIVTSAPGTPIYFVDGLQQAAADATTYTGSPMVPGTASTGAEPVNGEVRISSSDTQICGSDNAAGCTWTWYDGSKVLKSEIKVRSWLPFDAARCLIGHELGHGLGLAHVSDSTQLMNPVWTQGSSPCSYQRGDAAGLATMASVKFTL